jgi:hypothetical protein
MNKHLQIRNFKSRADFRLSPKGGSLAEFTCCVGLIGISESTPLI